jgi:hypothetical protein
VPSLRDSPLEPNPTRHFRAGLHAVPSLRDCSVAPSIQVFGQGRHLSISARENLEDGINVPQLLKPGMTMSYTVRLKPCPSSENRVLTQILRAGDISSGGGPTGQAAETVADLFKDDHHG